MTEQKQQLALVEKNPPASSGEKRAMSWIPGSRRFPWMRAWQPTPVFLPGKFHGQKSLADHGPWGHQESDMTERLSDFTCSLTCSAVRKRNSLQYSCLENSMDRGARQATVHEAAKSWTRLSTHTHLQASYKSNPCVFNV